MRQPVRPVYLDSNRTVARKLRQILERIETNAKDGRDSVYMDSADIQALQDAVDIIEGN